jgi:uncharacterized membrane protein
MQQIVSQKFQFLRTTAIGGVFFLLPLIIIGTFLGKFAQFCVGVAKTVESIVPLERIGGYTMLLAAGAAGVIGLCFLAGLIAKRSIAKRFTETIEKQLQIAFPRYAIVKDRLSGNIGGVEHKSELVPVLVCNSDGTYRFGLVVEKGNLSWSTVYLPGSPDPWAGEVHLVEQSKIRPIDTDFMQVMNSLEKLGRNLQSILKSEQVLNQQSISDP